MRIIIAASGTGGHLFCGVSAAKELKKRIPGSKLFFLGSRHKLVKKIVEENGFKFFKIYAAGLTGAGALSIIRFLLSQIIGIIQSGLLMLFIRPKIVISAGGFVSIGIVLWSRICGVPCAIHEQNIIPGKANRIAGYLADKVLISFDETKKYFDKNKCVFTGMPVRFNKKISVDTARKELGLEPNKFTILVMGGSRGAHRINNIVVELLNKLPEDIQFIHLTGNEDLIFVKEAYKKFGFNAYVEPFSNKMDLIYSASNVVVSRAGSGTLSEITYFGLPSILIPYPYSKDRHQYKNAGFMVKKGAAFILPEENMSLDILAKLIESRNNLQEVGKKSLELSEPKAAEKIVDEVMELINA